MRLSTTMSHEATIHPDIRSAAPDDIPAIRLILAQHGNDTPPETRRGPDIVGAYLRHLLARHRAMVGELPGEGVVAFGAVADAGISWHLADLFVREDLLGRGIGRPLLAALYEDRWPRTTFASADPRALPSYVRAGMAARWITLYLTGGPDTARRAAADDRARRLEVVDADPAQLAALELAWTGTDRTRDHELWTTWPGAAPFVIRDADGPVAVGYGRDRQTGPAARAVDRLVVRPGADPVGTALAAAGWCLDAGDTLDILVPGPHPALPVLLELGFRIDDHDIYCAGPTDPVDPSLLLPNGGLL
jgi:GNAT superfamily N-acetyltransferase